MISAHGVATCVWACARVGMCACGYVYLRLRECVNAHARLCVGVGGGGGIKFECSSQGRCFGYPWSFAFWSVLIKPVHGEDF